MHKLGEQWIEIIDGQKHMVKAVAPIELCKGCLFNCNQGGCCWKGFDDCQMGSFFIIKDLGILNDDGCLPEERTGEYPTIKKVVSTELLIWVWWVGIDRKASIARAQLLIGVEALTKQRAIDAWNWRVR